MNMKSVNVSDSLVQAVGGQFSPGERLRLVREQCGLTMEDIAGKLHLRMSVIELIEQDDYSNLTNFVFIRGYLRAYASLLGITADDIVLAFNQLGLSEPVVELPSVSKYSRRQYGVNHRSFRWLSYLIIVALIALVALGWNSYKNYSSDDQEQLVLTSQDLIFVDRVPEIADEQSAATNSQAAINLDVMPISEL